MKNSRPRIHNNHWCHPVLPTIIFMFGLCAAGCEEKTFVCVSDEPIPTLATDVYVQFDTDPDTVNNRFYLCGSDSARFDNRFSPYKGGVRSPDLVVEHFSALQCPHCARFAAYVDDMLLRRPAINARVRFYFHHYAFSDYMDYHMAAFAASQQSMEKFWQFHDILYATTNVWHDYQNLRDIAMYDLSLDMTAYDQATTPTTDTGMQAAAFLDYEKKTAEANCISGTPTVYLCGQPVADWRDLESLILEYLQTEN